MNRFKRAFRFKKSPADTGGSLVKVSQSTSSVDIESVSLEPSTDSDQWDTDDEGRRSGRSKKSKPVPSPPVHPDIEPNWSKVPLTTFSREALNADPPKKIDLVSVVDYRKSGDIYRNPVIIVVAELNQVLNVQLPRYIVALLSNYRFMNDDLGKKTEVEQFDLYLSQILEFLHKVADTGSDEYEEITARTGRIIAVLGSIVEVAGRNASQDVFLLSFQQQMISAFNQRHLDAVDVNVEFVEYLRHPSRRKARPLGLHQEDNQELGLADASIQTDTVPSPSFPVQLSLRPSDSVSTTALAKYPRPRERTSKPNLPLRHASVSPSSIITLTNTGPRSQSELEQRSEMVAKEQLVQLQRCLAEQAREHARTIQEKISLLESSQEKLRRLENTVIRLEAPATGGNSQTILAEAMRMVTRSTEERSSSCVGLVRDFCTAFHGKMDKAERKISDIMNAKDGIFRELSNQKSDFRRLLQELMCRDAQLSEASRDLDDLRAICRQKDAEIWTNRADLEVLEKRISTFTLDSSSNERRLSDLAEENEKLRLMLSRYSIRMENCYTQTDLDPLPAVTSSSPESEITEKLRVKISELEKLRLEHRELQQKFQETEKTHAETDGNFGTLIHNARKKDETIRTLQAGLTAAIADGNELRSDVVELKKQRKACMESLKELEERRRELAADIAQKDHKLCLSQERSKMLEAELANSKKICEDQSKQAARNDEKMIELQQNVVDLEQHVTFLERGRLVLSDEVQNIARVAEMKQLSLKHYEEEITKLEQNLRNAQHQTAFLEQNRAVLTEELQNTMKLLTEKEKVTDHHAHQMRSLEESLAEVQETNVRLKKEHGTVEEALKVAKAALEENRTKSSARFDGIQSELEQMRVDVAQFQDAFRHKSAEVDKFKVTLETVREQAAALQGLRATRSSFDQGDVAPRPPKPESDTASHKDQLVVAKKRIRSLEAEIDMLHETKPHQVLTSNQFIQTEDDVPVQKPTSPEPLISFVPEETSATSFHKDEFVQMRKRIRDLENELTAKQNIIRAMEYGREAMAQRVSGLQTENDQCEEEIRRLKSKLSLSTKGHEEQLDYKDKEAETRLKDALCRLAQKGEQLESARKTVEHLLKREEELNLEIDQLSTLKNQAELKAERVTDEASREIDELELQLKTLRDQKKQTKVDIGTYTDDFVTVGAITQTSISLQYGYDFETGCKIKSSLLVEPSYSREIQTQWPHEPCHVGVQVHPQTVSLGLQTVLNERSIPVQTECTVVETKGSQVEISIRSVATQTHESSYMDVPALPAEMLINVGTSISNVSEIIGRNRDRYMSDTEEDLDHDDRKSVKSLSGRSNATTLAEQRSARSGSYETKSLRSASSAKGSSILDLPNGIHDPVPSSKIHPVDLSRHLPPPHLPNAMVSLKSLHNVCQYLYDTLAKDPETCDVLVGLSNQLDYSLSQEDFDQQTGRRFLHLMSTSPEVRAALTREWKEDFHSFAENFRGLLENGPTDRPIKHERPPDKPARNPPESSPDPLGWVYNTKLEATNDEKVTKALLDFLQWFVVRRTRRKSVRVSPSKFRINGRKPVVQHSQLVLSQFESLQHFNDYMVICFVRIAHASKNLARTFAQDEVKSLQRLPGNHCDTRFAFLAMAFAKKSNKVKRILHHEIHGSVEEFFLKYDLALERKLQEMRREKRERMGGDSFRPARALHKAS